MNYLALHDYKKAIQLALSMSQPGRLLSLFKDAMSSPEDVDRPSIIGNPSVDEVIRTLGGSDLARLLRYVRDWNTNAKTSTVAQRVLLTIVKLRSAEEIIQAFGDETDEKVFADGEVSRSSSGAAAAATSRMALKELVDALIPYSERHLSRMEKLVQDSYVVDYILGEMDDGMFDNGFDDDAMEVDMV